MAGDTRTPAPREWNAPTYHRVSSPQFAWGQAVLDRLALRGDETVLDVGCGTGRLTEVLAERLPHGRAIGVDQSASLGTVGVGRAIANLALRTDHCAKLQPGHQLVGGLLLQFPDARRALQCGIEVAIEVIELRQLAFDLAQRRAVVDLVAAQHRFRVAPDIGSEATELRVVANHVLDAAVDLVREARKVRRFLDPGFSLAERGG